MPERSHLSIGEVLSLLREEFPDVTISKIRFLESQGLVDPERTPSGYRKFYDHDVERLRWILRQQRENFLPLKVIRGRLSDRPTGAVEGGRSGDLDGPEAAGEDDRGTGGTPAEPAAAHARTSAGGQVPHAEAVEAGKPGATAPGSVRSAGSPGAAREVRPGRDAGPPAGGAGVGSGGRPGAAATPAREATAPRPIPPALGQPAPAGGDEEESYSVEELAAAAATDVRLVHDLQQFGLIGAHAVVGGTPYFDAGALAVVRAAAGFARHGVEARHLKSWRIAADREAGLFEQVVMPLLRQRNPQARRLAAETLSELTSLGSELRAALVERAVREIR